ncbi:hypothetical protein [Acetobacter senegalensis]|uniref:hypothetical protein n=1 Tax=Acetobacter senegalensis TaxID=446692 RepID=UPI00128D62ED|nr:hypothetical protein [Acetobacter senegalensis]MPQ75260.1 hypothetical protein [Acetobacter senegalensis]
MTSHDHTRTPAASACQPDVVRLAKAQSSNWFSCMLFLGRFHVVLGFVRVSRAAARLKRLPPFAWLLKPYMRWEQVKYAMEWQRALDETWPQYHAAYQRLRAMDPSYPPLSEKAPRIHADLLNGAAR